MGLKGPHYVVAQAAIQSSSPKELATIVAFSGMLRRVALVRTDVSEELSASFIRMTRIGELGTTLAVTSTDARCEEILATLMMEGTGSSEMLVLIKSPRHYIPEDGILHSHRRENLKSYIALTGWTL
jgi:hypothetical protein